MRPLSAKTKRVLEKEPRMKRCTLTGLSRLYGACSASGRPEWHHVWIYAGRQIDEPWAIMAACHYHHQEVQRQASVRMAFEEASLQLATPEDLAKYPRKEWDQIKRTLGITYHDKKQGKKARGRAGA